MKVLTNITTKLLSGAELGELIYIKYGVIDCFCIPLKHEETLYIAFLNNPHKNKEGLVEYSSFYGKYPEKDIPIKSFGKSWVALPIEANTAEIDSSFRIDNHSGTLLIEKDRALISLLPKNLIGFPEATAFDTVTWTSHAPDRNYIIPITAWDIWATEDDYENYPDNPLVQIRA